MKKIFLMLTATGLLFAACKKNAGTAEEGLEGFDLNADITAFVDTVTLPQIIAADRTLYADTLYKLDGKVYVTGGTLTIRPGTHLEGMFAANPDDASALVVTKTGRIRSIGQQSNPVIMTSCLEGLPGGRTTRLPGDWAGLVILGDAPINQPQPAFIEGINPATVPAGVDVTYGGATPGAGNPDHDGGVVVFTRIEFAGAAIAPNNELNGLTCGGVGNGTGLRFIMVSNGADDAFEFFGGNVSPKYLIANSPNDDCFDFDFGYTGNVQFAFAVRNPALTYNDANGFEIDNDGSNSGATPTTRPILSNFTIVGRGNGTALPGTLNGGRFRRGTDIRLRNSIFLGYNTGVSFENTFASNTPLFFRNNVVHGYTAAANFVGSASAPLGLDNMTFSGAIPTNVINVEAPATHAGWKSSAPVYQNGGVADPANGSAVHPNFNSLSGNFLVVPYIGAFGPGSPIRDGSGTWVVPNNWAAGSAGAWVEYDPQ